MIKLSKGTVVNRGTMRQRLGALGVVVGIGVLGLTACTPPDSPTPSVPAPSTQVTQGDISPVLPPVPALDNPVGIRSSISLDSCSTVAGPVTASGKAINTTDQTGDVVIVVEWVTESSDVMARGLAVLRGLAPGVSTSWSATAQLDFNGAVTCVPTAQIGTLK